MESGALDEYLEDVSPEWTFIPTGVFPRVAEVYRGRAGALQLWEDMRGPWDGQGFYFEIERVEDLGDTVLGLCTIRAKGKESGAETSMKWAHVVSLNGDEVLTRNYASWDEALEAVGLRE